MSNKRFTDIKKWKNGWFRKLAIKAKLAWIYLCDECDFTGLFKIDYELASFQLDFDITPTLIRQWFGDKVYFISEDKIFIVPFYEFQYGESKDTWTAKVRAKAKIEALGFSIVDNKVVIPKNDSTPTVVGESTTGLIEVIVKGVNDLNKKEEKKNFEKEIEEIYRDHYPLKEGKTKGIEKLLTQIKSDEDLGRLVVAIESYKKTIKDPKFIKHFSTFVNTPWTDYLDKNHGAVEKIKQTSVDLSHIWAEK